MATQWPILVERLVALLPTLNGWDAVKVYDGPPVTADVPANFCTVGVIEEDGEAGEYVDQLSSIGNLFTTESGEIRSRLVVAAGNGSLAAVRATAFALIDELRASLRTDPLVGVLPEGSTTALTVRVASAQNSQGVGQRLDFILSYSCPVI